MLVARTTPSVWNAMLVLAPLTRRGRSDFGKRKAARMLKHCATDRSQYFWQVRLARVIPTYLSNRVEHSEGRLDTSKRRQYFRTERETRPTKKKGRPGHADSPHAATHSDCCLRSRPL